MNLSPVIGAFGNDRIDGRERYRPGFVPGRPLRAGGPPPQRRPAATVQPGGRYEQTVVGDPVPESVDPGAGLADGRPN